MVDTQVDVDPAVETEAKALGWTPKDQFKGDPDRWISAEDFVERGHSIMPILKKNNQELVGKLTRAQTDLAAANVRLATTEQSVKDLVAFQAAEVKRQVEERVSDLRAALREARKGDDDALTERIEVDLDKAKDRLKEASAPPPPAPPPPRQEPAPPEQWAVDFQSANSDWFEKDRKKTAVFMVIADELFKTTGLRAGELMARAKADMELTFAPTPAADKGEGGSRGTNGGGNGRTSGWDSLPSEAKAVCTKQEKQFVGKGKAFETQKAWRDHYVTTYNASN